MNDIKIGRITLAFTFISLGSLVFLEKISCYKLIDLFSVLWPSILIFLGLELIYTKQKKEKNIRLDKFSLLLILLLVSTIGIGSSVKFNYSKLKKTLDQQLKYKYRENISERISLVPSKKIIIDDVDTDIIIKRSENKYMEVILEGDYKYNKKTNYNDDFKLLDVEDNDEVIRISKKIKNKKGKIKNMNTEDLEYLIFLPEDVDLEVVTEYGDMFLDLEINDSNNIDIYCSYGDVSMILPKKQRGKFNITTNYGSIYDELEFDIIESASAMSINETRQSTQPTFNIRVINGNIILETD